MTYIQNKLGLAIIGALLMMLVAALAGVIYAGPLDPPGTPAPTQENLIFQPTGGCGGFPITISASGSYKLAQNITLPASCAANGIILSAADITLDLSGFTLNGGGSASFVGISTAGSDTVENGDITNFGSAGIALSSGILQNLNVHGNGFGVGAVGIVASRAVITNVVAEFNSGGGISVSESTLSDCVASFNSWTGITASNNSVVSGCTASSNSTAGPANGIEATGNGNQISNNAVGSNSGNGILLSGGRNTVGDNTVTSNAAEGIKATGGNNTIARNHASGNSTSVGNAEIYANGPGTFVEDNTLQNTTAGHVGVFADIAGSVIYGNTSRNGVAGSDFVTGGTCGCDVGTISTAAAATNPRGNVGD